LRTHGVRTDHVGNARPYVVFSLLKRFLVHEGYNVTFVSNITDINDKIYDAAHSAHIGSAELAREMADAYIADTEALGLGRPDYEPRASATIEEIIELIQELIEKGHAYQANGDVYFAVRSYPFYGELSHQDVDAMDQGEGVEGAERKRDPVDFALWKGNKPGEDTVWDSPWGRGGRDGTSSARRWRRTLLGVDFEIHGGGSDLIFPPPRERGRPDAGGARPAAGPSLGAQRDGPARQREDGQVGRQHLRATRRASRPTAATL